MSLEEAKGGRLIFAVLVVLTLAVLLRMKGVFPAPPNAGQSAGHDKRPKSKFLFVCWL